MTEKKERILWIDIAKAFAIFFVVVGHTIPFGSIVRKAIFSFHMPLFFIMAGFTFRTKPTKEVLLSSWNRLLLPYCLIFLAIKILEILSAGAFDFQVFVSSLTSFVFASGTTFEYLDVPAAGMSWFLVALFCARIVFNTAARFFERRSVSLGWQGLFWLIIAFFGICIGNLSDAIPFVTSFSDVPRIYLPFSFDIVLVSCFFMYVGWAFRQLNPEKLLDNWWMFVFALAIWVVTMHFSSLELAARAYDNWPLALIAACTGTFLCCFVARFAEKKLPALNGCLTWIGRNSMLIFCLHTIDWFLIPWTELPITGMGIHGAFIIVGCLRFAFDTLISVVVKRA